MWAAAAAASARRRPGTGKTGATVKPEDIEKLLTPAEKDALAVLTAGGFSAFTEAKLEDVRELGTGRRRPTWRNSGRYDLVVAFKKLGGRVMPGDIDPRAGINPEIVYGEPGMADPFDPTASASMEPIMDPDTGAEIDPPEIEVYPGQVLHAAAIEPDKIDPPAPALPPVESMNVEELRNEAKQYEDITGEYKMKKKELQAAVTKQRAIRREILNRKFSLSEDSEEE